VPPALLAVLLPAALLLAGCTGSPAGPTPTPTATATPSAAATASGAGATACTRSGGTVQSRQPTYGTNGPEASWIELGDPIDVCRWKAKDGSRIYTDLVTISSSKPTLAALAYLAKVQPPENTNGANPASLLCTKLGGASDFGTSLDGGGLVARNDPDDQVVDPCTFADGSFIEEWGIAYYAAGDVRGTDLTKVFAFSAPPAGVFAG
jgi:putative hemolysin